MLERLGRLSPCTQRILLIIGCLVLYCVWFIRVPLTEWDEVRYGDATRYMVATHNYMIPHYNGDYRFQKPILYYWIQSLPVRAFGVKEWAARLPSALLAILLVLLLHGFLLYWLPRRTAPEDDRARMRARGAALLGAIALATMPLLAIWARGATTDITTTFFICCALLAMLHADLLNAAAPQAPHAGGRWYVLSAAAMGLGFLTKGPMGLLIPGLVWLIYHGWQRNLSAEARRVPWGWAALVFVMTGLPWYVATYHYVKWDFNYHFFVIENGSRFANTMETHGTNSRVIGFFIYLATAILLVFPYSAFVLRDLFAPFAGQAQLAGDQVLGRMRRFAWVWVWVVIGLFSLAKTQLPSYIQAITVAAAILFTLHALGRLHPLESTRPASRTAEKGKWLETGLLLLVSLVFVVGAIIFLQMGMHGTLSGVFGQAPIPFPQGDIGQYTVALAGTFLLIGLAISLLRNNSEHLLSRVISGWTLLWAALVLAAGPCLVRASYQYPMQLGEYLRQHTPANEPVLVYARNPSEALVYYARRPLQLIPMQAHEDPAAPSAFRDAYYNLYDQQERFLIITDSSQLKAFHFAQTLTHAGDYYLFEIDPRAIRQQLHVGSGD